jgi:hypothetical protein
MKDLPVSGLLLPPPVEKTQISPDEQPREEGEISEEEEPKPAKSIVKTPLATESSTPRTITPELRQSLKLTDLAEQRLAKKPRQYPNRSPFLERRIFLWKE